MRQGIGSWSALTLSLLAASVLAAPMTADAAPKGSSKGTGLRQFTGVVTSLDKATLTVEKRGKTPRSVVFTRHAEMNTSGEVDKNARVTVYYSDEGGKSVAHRVVAKPERSRGSNGGS